MNRRQTGRGLAEPHPDAVVSAAADWLVAHDQRLSAAQQAEFERWLDADEQHPKIYAQLEQTWGMLAEVPVKVSPVTAAESSRQPSAGPRRNARPLVWLTVSLAAAAAIAFAYVTWWPASYTSYEETAATEVGAMQTLDLPDGSVVQLNTDSAVVVRYTEHERRVRLLRGEALFNIAKHRLQPFFVDAESVSVRAVGTAFNVRLRAATIDVLVTEGKVWLNDSSTGTSLLAPRISGVRSLLVAGERAVIPLVRADPVASTPVAVAMVPPAEVAQMLAWRVRQLEFSDEPLSEIAAEFNRYNEHKLVIADSRLGAQRFGGTFPSNDCEGFVRLLKREFGVVAVHGRAETVLRLP